MVSSVLGLITASGASVPATNFAPINISVSSMDCPPLIAWFAGYFDDPPMCLALARQIVGDEDRHERDHDDENRDDVGHRALPRPDQLGQHPDRQGRLLTGGERGHDNLVERQREGKHAAGEKRSADLRQDDVTEGLKAVGAEIHRRLDEVA